MITRATRKQWSSMPVLLLVALISLASVNTHANEAADLYEKALIAANQNETRAAIIHLKNALKADSDHIASHILLGRLYLREHQPELAEKALEKANNLGADRALIAIPLAHAYLQQNQPQRVLENFTASDFEPGTAAQLLVLQAKALIETRSLEAAEEKLIQASQLAPNSIEAYLGLAELALRKGQLPQSQHYLSLARDIDPDNNEVKFITGSLHHAQGHFSKALQAYSTVIKHEPKHLAARLARAGLYLDLGNNQSALHDIDAAIEHYPDDPRAIYLKAVLLARMDKPRAAMQALLEAGNIVNSLPEEIVYRHEPSLLLAGLITFSLGEYEKAKNYLERYVKNFPDNPSARKLLGATLIQQNDHIAAIHVLEPALTQIPNDYKLLGMLGNSYMKTGRHELAATMLERALQQSGGNIAIKQQLAFNNLARQQLDVAVTQLSEIFHTKPQPQTGITLALIHAKNNDFDKAAAIAQQLVESSPNNPILLNFLASMQLAGNQISQARQTLLKAVSLKPDLVSAQINLSRLESPSEAQQRLQELLDHQPGNVPVMLELSRIAQQGNDYRTALRWLEKARASNNKSIAAITQLIDLHITYGELDKALHVADQAHARFPNELRIIDALARTHLARQEFSKSSMLLQRMSALAGYNSRLLYRIAHLQLQARDQEQAVWSLQKAIKGDPKHLAAYLLLAELAIQRNNLALAKETAENITRIFPGRSEGPVLLGDIHLLEGDTRKAIALYQKAFSQQPSSQTIARLAHAHTSNGQAKKARALLYEWLASHPGDVVARSALAEHYLNASQWDNAAKHYENIIQINPDNPAALNNLAVIYSKTRPDKALQLARKAHQLLPHADFTNDTLGWILTQLGNPKEGIRYLRNAHARNAANPEFHYHLAVALYHLGRTEEARAALKQALDKQSKFHGIEHAEALAKELLLEQPDAT